MFCKRTEIVLKEGADYIIFLGVLATVFLYFDLSFLGFLSFLSMLFFTYIYRNPERVPEELDSKTIISPIDGKVKFIGKVFDDRYYKKDMLLIVLENSVSDMGVYRNPFDIDVERIEKIHGLSLPYDSEKAKYLNEKIEITGKSDTKDIAIEIVAGSCGGGLMFLCEGEDRLISGDRFIFFRSSQIYIYLPLECRLKATVSESVRGGESILGYFSYE